MQYLNTLPAEVLEIILNDVKDSVDLTNCSKAHPRLDAQLQKRKIFYLLPQVLPFIVPMLEVQDVLKIPEVFKGGRDAVQNFDNHVPGRLPYNDQLYLRDMKTLRKDPGEHKGNSDVWYLSFKKIGRDLRRIQTELKSRPEQVPFALGKSVSFDLSLRNYGTEQINMHKLINFLETYGQHFYYVKLRLTEKYTVALPYNCEYIRRILVNVPNARLVELDGDFRDQNCIKMVQEFFPYMPHLESLSLSLGNRNSELLEGLTVEDHAHQLKKLKLTARPGNLQKPFPCLVELHLHEIVSMEIFEDLKQLKAPLLQKLTLEMFEKCQHLDSAVMLEKIAHLPLRQLILKWEQRKLNLSGFRNNRSVYSKFRKIQFPSVHTLTLCNFPDDWRPLLVSFPSLTYLNIRINVYVMKWKNPRSELRRGEELDIRKILYGEEMKLQPFLAGADAGNFPQLEQVSFEMWKHFGRRGAGKLVHCRKWTKNLQGSADDSTD